MRSSSVTVRPRFCSVFRMSVRSSERTEQSWTEAVSADFGGRRRASSRLSSASNCSQVVRHLVGRRHLAVEAAARLRRDVAPEQAPRPRARRTPSRGRRATRSSQLGHERLGQPARLVEVHRVLELVLVEVEDEEGHRPAVHRGAERHRAERVREGAPQRRLDLVGVAQPREGHVEGLVARAPASLAPRSRRRSPRARCAR